MKGNVLACALVLTIVCSNTIIGCSNASAVKPANQEFLHDYELKPIILSTIEPIQDIVLLKQSEVLITPEPTAEPTAKPKPKPKQQFTFYKTRYGKATTYGPGYGGYLALPEGGGILVEVCGPVGCILRRSNDAGPSLASQRAGRVVDLNIRDFEIICGCQWNIVGVIKNVRVRYISE
jgi:hypothetical protein